MPTAPTRPTNYPTPFAVSGTKNTIPANPTGTNRASFTEGFPPVTMQPITAGGQPPSGNDFNGLFFDYSTHIVWINAGGQYQFDAALSTAMGGYPQGMVLQSNDGLSSYVSLVNNNTTDFNSTPSSIGSLWGAYSGAAFSNAALTVTGGVVTLTAVQAVADMITLSGTLTSNATVTFPAALSEYVVVNNTIGAFTVTCIPTGGAGVQIRQGSADAIYCDGTNIGYQQNSATTKTAKDAGRGIANTLYADRAADRVGGGYVDTGTANAYVIATVPPSTAPADYQTVRFRASHASTGVAATLDIGGGPIALVTGDGNNPRPNDITSTAITTATYVAAVGKWIINGLIVPDILISNAIYVTSTQTLIKGNFNFNTVSGAFGCNLNSTPNVGDTIYGADPTGDWATKPITIAATGGILIAYVDRYGTLHTGSTWVDDVAGHWFKMVYDGTYWRLT
jgi:hypothetical protein